MKCKWCLFPNSHLITFIGYFVGEGDVNGAIAMNMSRKRGFSIFDEVLNTKLKLEKFLVREHLHKTLDTEIIEKVAVQNDCTFFTYTSESCQEKLRNSIADSFDSYKFQQRRASKILLQLRGTTFLLPLGACSRKSVVYYVNYEFIKILL